VAGQKGPLQETSTSAQSAQLPLLDANDDFIDAADMTILRDGP
jgi:hypothetical protein